MRADGRSAVARIGVHVLEWVTPEGFGERFGQPWKPAPHDAGEVAVLHLLVTDLDRFAELTSAAGRTVGRQGDAAVLEPEPSDGLRFSATQRPVEDWLAERTTVNGERIVVHRQTEIA